MHRKLISSAVLTLIALAGVPAAAAAAPGAAVRAEATTQLPRGVSPSHYQLSITPDARAASFSAKAAITLTVSEPTATITLHANELRFAGAVLQAAGQPDQAASAITLDAAAQTATLRFARPLAKGRYILALDYSGKIRSQATGLFSLDYDSAEGSKRALYTQFENSDARAMIPCWDEPAYKATFALDVTVPSGEMAVGNMPATGSTELGDGRKRVQFATTPKMSTYLLFLAVGDFERATAMVDGTELGVVTKRGALPQARYALDESQALLREFNNYFGVRYPLPKLDNIAAPGRSQFFGAMENWGAIFTFEYALLVDPRISTQSDKQGIYMTLAHEMAHQWFGDLVTMRWWDNLWLNEGFASWMEARTTERLHPEWNTHIGAVGARESAFASDALQTTHPIVQPIATVEQASQAFDNITYQKGEAVIRMLEAYVGADAWRQGVRAYMRQHAYGNTVSDDLWRHVERAAGKPVTAIAHDFTLRAGVPLIRVGDAVCSGGQSRLTLTQGEFSKDRPDKKPGAWRVPVLAQTPGKVAVRALVSGGKASISVPGCGPVLVNAGQSGYYRTLYTPRSFAAVAAGFAALAPIDQLGVLSDTYALGMAGLQPTSDFLELARATPLDADTQVWGKIAAILRSLHDNYQGEPQRQQKFAAFAIARLAPLMAKTGWTPRASEPDTVANLRAELIAALGRLGDPAVIAEARRRYAAQAGDPAAMPAALRRTILGVVAQNADSATWESLHAAALSEKTPLVRNHLYDMLAYSKDGALAQRALELALTDEPGLTNSPAMINMVAAHHPDLAFDFALAHLPQVNARVDSNSRSRYFPRLASGSADPAMIAKVNAYASSHLPADARADAATSVANIKYRIKLRKERLPTIDAWLARTQQ
ncbi:M1 family metallopeptidase [Janthinobacterium fluminis]|uniref:Aminopeptidase n=1 Tax=Janthinobacterium fluminis TaxID=2987524 RepID=A0ABT5JUG1_9BURK|nr:M1 family metallopeptidase [Janthinobacterium fluminis]MDC8756398.1 M1 family metallopeptidase [Janthinobacterium fluminis]